MAQPHRKWTYAAAASWTLLAVADAADALNVIQPVPIRIHGAALTGSLALVIVAAFTRYDARSVKPIREAFMHGYKLGREHVQIAETENLLAPTGTGAQIVRMPSSAYTATATQPRPGPAARRRQGRSPRRTR